MPAEPTHAKVKRRSSRKDFDEYRFDGSHARELEQKRSRGEVSCAECRRLKIKCDKQIPCQSCQRRGCAALCPNGSLSTGQGTRFVLAATEHLHRRISNLSGRIRQLEDALSSLQAKHSADPHPLLHEDLVVGDDDEGVGGIGIGMGGVEEEGPGAVAGHAPDIIDAFGTLSISDHGISRFFGPTGGSESLLLANLNASSDTSPSTTTSPHTPSSTTTYAPLSSPASSATSTSTSSSSLALFSQSFPFTPMGAPTDVQALVETHLPTWETASSLVQTYLDQVSWIFHGVTRAQLVDDMLPAIYRREEEDEHAAGAGEDYSGPHDLALLFIILAVGALVRPEPEGREGAGEREGGNNANALGEHYHQISRAALALQPVLEKPSIVTIQTLHLMSIYNAMSGSDLRSETSMEMTWSLITLAAHLSQTIGLHRDSARWGLSKKMVQRRRILFWDLFVADVWQSLNTGRPPSFSLAYIDCSFPGKDDGMGEGAEGGFGSAFSNWQCRFAAECVAEVTARTLTAEAPSYATIMELDKKVRDFPLPEGMGAVGKGEGAGEEDMAGSFQRCVLDHIRETVLMYIHRSFFAQAIIEQPVNPLKSAYAPSFLAAYRASSTILKSVREQFGMWPNSCARFWTMWTFAFSAAVVFGTVVTRGPRSPLAQGAMTELEQACILFRKASVYSIRCTKALPILTKLAEKARHALAAIQKDPTPISDAGGQLWNIQIKQEDADDDELAIFAGHTRFVSAKKPPPIDVPLPPPIPPLSYPTHAPVPLPQHQQYNPAPPQTYPGPQVPPIVSGWGPEEAYMSASRREEEVPQQLPPPTLHYPYVASERTHQLGGYEGGGSEWEDERRSRAQHQQSYPQMQMQMQPPRVVPSQYEAPYALLHKPQQYRPLQHQPQPQPYQYQHQHQPQATHEYQTYPSHIPQQTQPHHQSQYRQQQQQQPAFHTQTHLPNAELADLGLAARDSRLDERWSSFMQDSGLLEGLEFQGR
ncbi:fungal-specific transcription factor domain-containing protein [Lyophyllum atratum]|nr:fungal-specific transcription factor domain-containing protein [Lyophyllum atratum]